jgi:hypothetical protein
MYWLKEQPPIALLDIIKHVFLTPQTPEQVGILCECKELQVVKVL